MKKTISALCLILVLAPVAALAGPPLVCHSIDIGTARSLPWFEGAGWDGADPAYDVARLGDDTVAVLDAVPRVSVRRETLRRAAIYAARRAGLAERLSSRLLARAEATDGRGPDALFDAGYFIETVRAAARVVPMLRGDVKAAWMIRSDPERVDGLALIERAIAMGGGAEMRAVAAAVASERSTPS